MTRTQIARALGKLGAGVKKTMSEAAVAQRRRAALESARVRRERKAKRDGEDCSAVPVASGIASMSERVEAHKRARALSVPNALKRQK